MNNSRKIAAALLLTLALSASTFAGEMHTDGSPAPPPASGGMQAEPAGGEMHTDGAAQSSEVTDALIEVARDLLQSLLTLF